MLEPEEIEARAEAMVGSVLGGRYRLDEVLGIGAMGAVFRGYHTGLQRDVAIKLLHKDLMSSDEMRTRFSREAAAISKLDHPNCVRVSDYGSDDEYQYLVMELLRGAPLSAELEEALPPLRALELIDEILAGLEHAHGHGLIHRDIKPDNIYLAEEGAGQSHAKLLDFGIVKLQEQQGQRQLTQVGMVFGTPHFMSPEQAMGSDVDARTDLYAIGILLYQMLAGALPFDSDDPVKVLRQQIQEPPPALPSSVPPAITEIVERLLAKEPDDRFPSATAARNALAEVRRSLEPQPEPMIDSSSPTALAGGELPLPGVMSSPTEPAGLGSGLGPSTGPIPSGNTLPAAPSQPIPAVQSAPLANPSPELPVAPAMPPSAMAPTTPGGAVQGQGPALVVPSRASSPKTVWIAGGVGLIVLVVAIIVATGGDDSKPESDAQAAAQTDDAAKGLGALLGGDGDDDGKEEPSSADAADASGDEDVVVEDEGDTAAESDVDLSLQASLTGIDNMIEAKNLEGAQMQLQPLIDLHPDDAQLHLRMARVLTGLRGIPNRTQALASYSKAIKADRGLLDDEEFMAELSALVNDKNLREAAVGVAIDHLGSKMDDTLVSWLNIQKQPLSYSVRHRIIAHLRDHDRSAAVNQPLQAALDLWQVQQAGNACSAFDQALDAVIKDPDSFMVGTLRRIKVPEGDDGQACSGAEAKLEKARTQHEQMFAGIDPVVPRAYRNRGRGRGR